jgi:hypothetical protein
MKRKAKSEFEQMAEEYRASEYGPSDSEPEPTEPAAEPTAEVVEPEPEPVPVEPEPTEPEPVAEPEPEATPSDEPEGARLYTVPDHEMYGELRGKKVTAKQLEEAGLINKVITCDHQEMHNARLYNDLKRDFDERLERSVQEAVQKAVQSRQEPPAAPPLDQKAYSENVERNYVPHLAKLAEEGAFEPAMLEYYPKFTAHIAHQLETLRFGGQGIVAALNEIREWVGMQQGREARDQGMGLLDSAMTSLAAEDPLCAGLADASERTKFTDWMASKDNPQPWRKLRIDTELAKPDTLRGAYAAYRATVRDEAPPAAPVSRERARMASSGPGVSRAAPTSKVAKDEFSTFKSELNEARSGAFGM